MAGYMGPADAVLENLIQLTKLLIDHEDPKEFVLTYAARAALKTLLRFGSILITGISGSGKTRLGLKLLQELSQTQNRVPIILTSSKQWHLIPKKSERQIDQSDNDQHSIKYIVMVDNIFGSSCLVETWVEEWSRMFDIMFPYVESGQIFLIITSRPEIIFQREHCLKKYALLETMHCVSLYTGEYELKKHEKRTIMRKCCGKNISFKENEIEEILDIKTSIGLPQCCKFYARSRTAQAKGIQFFHEPFDYIKQEIAALQETDPLGYLVLLLVVMLGGRLVNTVFGANKCTQDFKDLVETLGEFCCVPSTPSLKRIKTKAELLCGVFLKQMQGSFQFCHQTVFDAVFLDIANRFPEKCIAVCPAKVLVDLVRTLDGKSETSNMTLLISEDDFGILVHRITQLILSESCLEILDHPSLHHDDFVQDLFEILSKNNNFNRLVTIRLPEEHMHQGFSAVDISEDAYQPYWAKVLLFSHENILSHMILKKMKLFDLILDRQGHCVPPEVLQQLLPSAIYVNNTTACQKLINLGALQDGNCVRALCGSPFAQGNTHELNELVLEANIQWNEFIHTIPTLYCLAVSRGNTSLLETLYKKAVRHSYSKRKLGEIITSLFEMFWAENVHKGTLLTNRIEEDAVETILASGCETDMNYLAWLASGHLNAVALNAILKRDVNINRRYHGRTSLHQAVQFGGSQCVSLLLDHGADIFSIVEVDGNTVLHLAAQTSRDAGSKTIILIHKLRHTDFLRQAVGIHEEIIHSRHCVDDIWHTWDIRNFVNKRNYAWNTPLHMVSRSTNTDCMKTLIQAGAEVNVKTLHNDTPLHWAVTNNALDSVKVLTEAKASVHMTNIWGSIPLNDVHNTNTDIVKVLLDAGSDANSAKGHNGSCLHIAAISGDMKTMKLLFKKGADVNVANRQGQTCLMTATIHGDLDVIKYLCEQGARTDVINSYGQTVIHTTLMLETDTAEKLQYLLDVQHAPVDVKDEHGRSAMFLAVQSGDTEIVELLHDRGFDLEQVDEKGNTLLHAACESKLKNTSHLLKLLVSRNSHDVQGQAVTKESSEWLNTKNGSSDTVISLIAENGLDCDIQFLIEKGANPNIQDHRGRTPLHYFAEKGRYNCTNILLESGAQLCVTDAEGNTPLHLAAKTGDHLIVGLLLNKGADPHATNLQGKLPLHVAAGQEESKLVQMFLDKGVHSNQLDNQGQTPLFIAAIAANSGIMKVLLRSGADPCTSDKEGRTVLHIMCAKRNSKEVIILLLKNGSNPSALDKNGRTPLHIAAESGNTECINLFLERGADMDAVDKHGWTALHVGAKHRQNDFVTRLIDNGANLYAVAKFGQSALHVAAENESWDCILILLDRGLDPKLTDKRGRIPLHLALTNTVKNSLQLDCFKKLLQEVNPSSKDSLGNSVLHVAIGNQLKENDFVRLLIKQGADVHVTDKEGRTPLHVACLNHTSESIKLLLDAGADLNIFDCHRRTPLLIAAKARDSDLVKFLLEAGADPNVSSKDGTTPLHFASNMGSSVGVHLLLNKGGSPSASTTDGMTPLHFACMRFTEDIATLLLQEGADVHVRNTHGQAPLHIAAGCQTSDIVKLLLRSGSDPNMLDIKRQSPLHIAVFAEIMENVRLLLDSGADPGLFGHHSLTPLHLAAKKWTHDIAKLLLCKGADCSSLDDQGRTPLHIASEIGNGEMVELLLYSGADPRLKDNVGSTPLHLTLAAITKTQELTLKKASNYLSTLTSLVQFGSDISTKDVKGLTCANILYSLKRSSVSSDSHLDQVYLSTFEARYHDRADVNYYESKVAFGQFIHKVNDIFHGKVN